MSYSELKEQHPEYYGKIYLFFRKEGFYIVELGSDDQARENAEINPGTIKVEDVDRNIVWSLENPNVRTIN